MNPTDKTAPSQTDSLAFDFDLPHSPEKVWRALTDPALLAKWLLPVTGLKLEPGTAFTFKTQPYPGWDGTVSCRMLEADAHRKLSYAWVVGAMDTVVTFTLTPTASGTLLSLVHSGFKPDQKQNFGGARYGWKLMGGKLVELLASSTEVIELEQRGSPDPPLGVDCLHGGRHRQRRRPWESRSSPPRASAVLGEPPGAHPARLARAHGALPVRASLRRQVAQRATHRLMPSGAPTQQLIIQQSNKEGDEPRIDRVNTDLIHPSTRKGRTTDRHG